MHNDVGEVPTNVSLNVTWGEVKLEELGPLTQ